MMKVIARNELAAYAEVIRRLVEQENARGDNLSVELLNQDLVQGGQYMVAFAKDPNRPLLVLLCQAGHDRLRGTSVLWVHNFYLHDPVEFKAADWSAESRDFDAHSRSFSKVQFMTDSPPLLAFLAELGYYAQAVAMVCDLTKDSDGSLTARRVAAQLSPAKEA